MVLGLREPRSGFVDACGARLHYVTHGDPTAPCVVLVHGMRDHARSWDWVAAALADRFHVVAPDLRGHGDSSQEGAAGYSMAAFVLDLAILIDALALGTIGLVGHSLGGAIAIRYAGAFPDRLAGLCAIESVELPIVREEREAPTPFPERLAAWIAAERDLRRRPPRSYGSFAEAEVRMAEGQPDLDTDTIAHLVRHGMFHQADGSLRWKYDNAARRRAPDDADGRDLDQTLAAITCPTMLAYGEASWIPLPPPERLARIRDHRIVAFPGASHWLHHQSRAAFLAALNPFLDVSIKGHHHA